MHRITYCVETYSTLYLFRGRDRRRVLPGRTCDIYERKTLSVVTLEWSEITGTYNTPDTM